jgi:3-hydroxyisobutyrate dehydrogenase-like beta-hydroxyacid dehydrogenase
MEIEFIGLGQMGDTIAGKLIKAGPYVTVWNRSGTRPRRWSKPVCSKESGTLRASIARVQLPDSGWRL